MDTLGNKTFVTISEVSGAEQCVFISTWEPVSRIRRPDYPRCFDFRVTFKTGSIVVMYLPELCLWLILVVCLCTYIVTDGTR